MIRLSITMLILASTTSAQQHTLYRLYGAARDAYGVRVARIGDVNRDGHSDFAAVTGANNPYVHVVSGADARTILVLKSTKTNDGFGASVAGPGDLNGDGYPDVVVGAPSDNTNGPSAGAVYAFSGRNGSIVHRAYGIVRNGISDHLGETVSACGDVDKDGRPDYAAGTYDNTRTHRSPGFVNVYSGRTGSILRVLSGSQPTEHFGTSIAHLGDVDRDGHSDVLIGSSPWFPPLIKPHVTIWSGKNGKLLRKWTATDPQSSFGSSVAGAGDVNGDLVPDVLVGASGAGGGRGAVYLLSGKDGSTIRQIVGDRSGDYYGQLVTGGIDVDRDNVPDMAAGSRRTDNNALPAYVRVYCGRSGKTLLSFEGPSSDYYGVAFDLIDDVNRDGFGDVLIGAPADTSKGKFAGRVDVLNGVELSLLTDRHSVSTTLGGVQVHGLLAGPAQAGKIYIMLGSASGVWPGIQLGSLRIPLNYDAYTGLLLSAPNALFHPGVGVLDSAGRAVTQLFIPPNVFRPLAGLSLHHAFVILNPQQRSLDFASSAASVLLTR